MAELEQVGKEAPPGKEGEWVGCQRSSDTSAGSSEDVINLGPSSEEETGPWQDALDYKGDNDQEPGVCPHDCATKGMGGLCRTGRTASGKPHGQQEKSTQPAHKESTSTGPCREDSSPSKLHMDKLKHPAHQEPTSAGPCPEDSPPTQIPTKPEQPLPSTSQEATAKQPVTAALDWPQQLAGASGQAFTNGLEVAFKPLEEEMKRQTKLLEKIATIYDCLLKALKDHSASRGENAAGGAAGNEPTPGSVPGSTNS